MLKRHKRNAVSRCGSRTYVYILFLLVVLATGCAPIIGHGILAGSFLVSGYATRHEEVTPYWQVDWPELPCHEHIETREQEGTITSRGLWR
jgi:hypothetical protein